MDVCIRVYVPFWRECVCVCHVCSIVTIGVLTDLLSMLVSGGSLKAPTLTPETRTGFTQASTSNVTGPAALTSFNLDLI